MRDEKIKTKFQSMTDGDSILDNACSPGRKGFMIPAWWWLASDVVSTQLSCIPVATGNGRGKLCTMLMLRWMVSEDYAATICYGCYCSLNDDPMTPNLICRTLFEIHGLGTLNLCLGTTRRPDDT